MWEVRLIRIFVKGSRKPPSRLAGKNVRTIFIKVAGLAAEKSFAFVRECRVATRKEIKSRKARNAAGGGGKLVSLLIYSY